MTERVDCIVIGAGVVGLACARQLAQAGREVLILEAAGQFGTGASSRNSEVIHAGIYYPAGSLKADLCVRGRELLYRYCEHRGINHRRCGKLVVATSPAQIPDLEALDCRARANGVEDVRLIDATTAHAMEPALICVAALHVPATGIIDSHALMLSLLGDAERAGAMLALRTPVIGGRVLEDGILLHTGGDAAMTIVANTVINAAGLFATQLAHRLEGFPPEHVPQAFYAKGSYFSLTSPSPFSRLIYPVPEPGGLGVHLTLDLQGRARFGPDVEWLDDTASVDSMCETDPAFDYRVDPARASAFYEAIRHYWPGLGENALAADYAGVRAKIAGPGQAAADFRIDGQSVHGVCGVVNLFGIESPGLTASLAIAQKVADTLSSA